MKFSVIIPLEYHRFRASECVEAWSANQGIPAEEYEILCVVPPGFPSDELQILKSLLRPHDRVVMSSANHDIAHCAEAAQIAEGDLLFFTESHVVPSREVLKQCSYAFDEHPDWAALCCRSSPVAHNRLARVEARMYVADIEYGMNSHPWRKILDQCFVTRRPAYLQTDGFQPELGHFAEWALAAQYRDHSLLIGYAPDIELRHYYSGRFAELRAFTEDFTAGEVRYFSRSDAGLADLLEAPPEWLQQGNWNRSLARSLLLTTLKTHLGSGSGASTSELSAVLRALIRWAPAAVSGLALARAWAKLAVAGSRLRLCVASLAPSDRSFSECFIGYIQAVIHAARLETISSLSKEKPGAGDPFSDVLGVSQRCGFHLIEQFEGDYIVWSEPAAGIDFMLEPGEQSVRLRCAPVRHPISEIGVSFWFNGSKQRPDQVCFDGYDVVLEVRSPGGSSRLVWVCEEFHSQGDLRPLGLPLLELTVLPASVLPQTSEIDSADSDELGSKFNSS